MGEVTRAEGGAVVVSVRPPRRWELVLYAAVRAAVAGFCKVFWRLEVEGAEHLPAEGAFVLAPVHRSNVDFALVSTLVRRRMRYIGKDSLWQGPRPFGRFISALGAFPVKRGAADRTALRTCTDVISAGEPLVMFPEGTRQSGPLVTQLFDGPAYVAARTRVPLIPVGIGGSERAMPKGSKVLRPVKLRLIIGEPLVAPLVEGERVPRREVRRLTEQLATRLQRLFDAAQVRAG